MVLVSKGSGRRRRRRLTAQLLNRERRGAVGKARMRRAVRAGVRAREHAGKESPDPRARPGLSSAPSHNTYAAAAGARTAGSVRPRPSVASASSAPMMVGSLTSGFRLTS